MKNNFAKITLFALAAALIAVPAVSRAADATNAPAATAPAKKHVLSFHGKATAVDTASITVGGLTINITSDTKIKKDGKAATLSDIKVGDTVGGSYTKDDAGKLTAATLHSGEKKKKSAPATP